MLFCSDDTHPDSVLICPYDKNHKITRKRFQRHLVRCERNFPEGYLEICPFNASHRFFKEDLKKHILTCPMKRFLEPSKYQGSLRNNEYMSSRLISETTSTIDFIEYWSDDESEIQQKKSEEKRVQTNVASNDNNDSEDEDEYSRPLRRPYGYSQMMLMEANDTIEDDMVSVMSYMGMGRGRGVTNSKYKYLFQKIALGRGRGISLSKN